MSTARSITVLGSTGSIGQNALDVISRHRDRYEVVAMTANTDVDALEQQCLAWQPQYAVMSDAARAQVLFDRLRRHGLDTQVLEGVDGLIQVSRLAQVDTVIAGIVGAAGLQPTLSAARAGKRILLANKEALVMSGQLFMDAVRDSGAVLLPVDSEHNAIFQCMPPKLSASPRHAGVDRILLTASGGPFRTTPLEEFSRITPQQAVSHPNWVMGQKISVDSATMMNKGLEVIEAHWLFDVSRDMIEVVIHPQSIIHSMVSYTDGSILAQLGNPDMRTPIAHCLAWPDRIDSGVEPLNIFDVAKLEFEKPDLKRFPCLELCYQAMQAGDGACIALNAANEIAVETFLQNRIAFTSIAGVIEHVLADTTTTNTDTLDEILSADRAAREVAWSHVSNLQTV